MDQITIKEVIENIPVHTMYNVAKEFIEACNAIGNTAEAEGKDGDEDYWFEDEITQAQKDFLTEVAEWFHDFDGFDDEPPTEMKLIKPEKLFFWKDMSGGGRTATFTLQEILSREQKFGPEFDDTNELTLADWAENADEGDEWGCYDHGNYTCIKS